MRTKGRSFRPSRQTVIGLAAIVLAVIWNPGPHGTREREHAKALYRQNCASCHGIDGLGDGPDADSLSNHVPDLMTPRLRNGRGLGSIRHSIADGFPKAGMPAFRGKLKSVELDLVAWELVRMRRAYARQSPPPPPPVGG